MADATLRQPPKGLPAFRSVGKCRSIDEFEVLNKIGAGTYGVVFRAREKSTGTIVALKKVRMEKEKEGVPLTALREIKLLRSLDHPNIVRLLDVAVEADGSLYMVFEYCEHDLAALLENDVKFTEAEIKCLLKQLLSAVICLHDSWIIHRDLKMSNLLFTNRGVLKLCDFGLARQFGAQQRPYTPHVVTIWYRAPELLFQDTVYTPAIDMWALGCIFGELLLQRPLLPGRNDQQQIELIVRLLGTPNDRIWPSFRKLSKALPFQLPVVPYSSLHERFSRLSPNGLDLLKRMLTYDPAARITAKEALEHPYFSESPLPQSIEMMPTFPSLHDSDIRKRKADESAAGAPPPPPPPLPPPVPPSVSAPSPSASGASRLASTLPASAVEEL